jgi:hypothetical protein
MAALQGVVARGGVNVVVTASHATAALAKLLLFGITAGSDYGGLVAPHRVYSAAHRPKSVAFAQALVDLAAEFQGEAPPCLLGTIGRPLPSGLPSGPGKASPASEGGNGGGDPGEAAARGADEAPAGLAARLAVVCVGDGDEEASAAAALGLPFVRVRRGIDLGGVAAACDAALGRASGGSHVF